MIIEIDPNTIAPADHQHRQDFSHVISLARSILQNGQQTPIQVYKLSKPQPAIMTNFMQATTRNGRLQATTTTTRKYQATYKLIAGETRTRACIIAGVRVKAIIEEKPNALKASIGTLTENLNRKQPNPTEEAQAYKKVYDLLSKQGTPEPQIIPTIAEKTGKSERVISDRLALLDLIEPFQVMIDKGSKSNGGINKAHALSIALDIPKSYQLQLYRWYEANGRSSTDQEIEIQINHIKKLYYDSLQSTMFSFDQPDTATTAPIIDMEIRRPTRNGRTATPQTLDPLQLSNTINLWLIDIDQWQKLGHHTTADRMLAKCEAMETTLTAVIASPFMPLGRILALLSEAETTTTGKLQRNLHLSPDIIYDYLELLRDRKLINTMKSGRGERHQITNNGKAIIADG